MTKLKASEAVREVPPGWVDQYTEILREVYPPPSPDDGMFNYTPLAQIQFLEAVLAFCNLQFDVEKHKIPPTDVLKGIFAKGVMLGVLCERHGYPISMPDPHYASMVFRNLSDPEAQV